VKYLPILALTVAISACAATPPVSQVGTSQQPPKVVAQCIAQKWADKSQQQVVAQATLANDQAMDVYVPGQQPPAGAAATVHPNGGTGSWVGFRSGGGSAGGDASGSIQACL
jgi:hypothetical protein